MRVALVIERMDPLRGGRETSIAQIAVRLAEAGCGVTILCQEGGWQDRKVEVLPLGRRGMTRTDRLRNFVADVRAEADATEYDIVHTSLPIPGADVYQLRSGTIPAQAAASFRRRRRPERWVARALARTNRLRRLLEALEREVMADPTTACLPVSRMVAGEIERYYGRSDNVRVVYNAVEKVPAAPEHCAQVRRKLREWLGADEDAPVFVTVAMNPLLKGVDRAIAAFAEFVRRSGRDNARLVVVSPDPRGLLRSRASSLGVGHLLAMPGATEDVHAWYIAADACVLLSWYDPCSRVVLEATRWAVPSITTAYNGASEVLADGAGIVVDSPLHVGAVAEAMVALADPAERGRRAAACREISPTLSMERHVAELLETYGTLTER